MHLHSPRRLILHRPSAANAMSVATLDHLPLLLERPLEPVFTPRRKANIVFSLPPSYVADRFKTAYDPTKFPDYERVTVSPFGEIPLQESGYNDVGLEENFSVFVPKHLRTARRLIGDLLGIEDTNRFIAAAFYIRDRVNAQLFSYALTIVLLHKPETRHLRLPPLIQCFPDRFFSPKTLDKIRKVSRLSSTGISSVAITPESTAVAWEEENKLAYFREDLGVNLHHWHWHAVYPTSAEKGVVDKDRRGELFYYMHQQIIARYNFERLCNDMDLVVSLSDLRAPIKEAYFPKLTSKVAKQDYGSRAADETLKNLRREVEFRDVIDLERWRERILEAISRGSVELPGGKQKSLTEEDGIDILGNLIEASELSVNPQFYGNLHGMGHLFISAIHDPDSRYQEKLGVMSELAAAMRDPLFYRWHGFVDDLFNTYKKTLPPYTEKQLVFEGIEIKAVSVETGGFTSTNFATFFLQSKVEIAGGLDFLNASKFEVVFEHLDHRPFTYTIEVVNSNAEEKIGTCRIFLAPLFDDKKQRWKLSDQRRMFIELDKFKVTLPKGRKVIVRESGESSVAIPFDQIFKREDSKDSWCGCGWPQYMLIPKGTPIKMPCQLFVMISNYEDDRVVQESGTKGDCVEAYSYCGLKDKKYPDRRAMGFPFDRNSEPGVTTIQEFCSKFRSNMIVTEVTILDTEFNLMDQESSNK